MYLDTHVVAWLYAGEVGRFPAKAAELLETQPLAVSPMVELELQYLLETGRTREPGRIVVEDLARRIGLEVRDVSLADVAARAADLSWTRDPFDRLIAAQASLDGARLLTADRIMLDALPEAVWD